MNMNKVSFALAALAATGTVTCLAISPVAARPLPSETVETAGYDLNSDAGYANVSGQIRRAATRVCGATNLRNLSTAPEAIACRDATMANAMAQLDRQASRASVTVIASR